MRKCPLNRQSEIHKSLLGKPLHTALLCWDKITGDNFQRVHNRYEAECRKMPDK